MRTTPEIENIEDWLIREALGQPDIGEMFSGFCERLVAAAENRDLAAINPEKRRKSSQQIVFRAHCAQSFSRLAQQSLCGGNV